MRSLSILICTLPQRVHLLRELLAVLEPQAAKYPCRIEIRFHDAGPHMSTGAKRQALLHGSFGDYVTFIDDDDMVPAYYCDEMLKAIDQEPDCVGINGTMTTDGHHETIWRLSKDYGNFDKVEGNRTVYYRHTNHITAVKRSIALAAGFPDKSNAEDKYYSDRLILHTEVKIEPPMYHYRFSTKNKTYK